MANMKTGSTTIHKILGNVPNGTDQFIRTRIVSQHSRHTKPIGKHATYREIANYFRSNPHLGDINTYRIFGYVREPCERMLSAYYHEIKQGQIKNVLKNT